jgi:hypothetical protein
MSDERKSRIYYNDRKKNERIKRMIWWLNIASENVEM